MSNQALQPRLNSPISFEFAEWVNRLPESEIRRLLRYTPEFYFAGGKPGILPVTVFHQIIEEIIAEEKGLLQTKSVKVLDRYNYGATEGNILLRTILANRLAKRDHVQCTAEDILITTGSQQTLFAINDALIKPGDIVLTTRPTYLGFLLPAEKIGAKIVTLPSDKDGLLPEYIDVAMQKCRIKFGKFPKIIYVIPYSDNPKGTTLPNKRKKQIIDSVYNYNDLLIVEDVAYKEIQFKSDENGIHPLKEMDPENQRVAYLSTSTKEAASFRIGYSVLPKKLREAMIKGKGYYDLCSSEFVQAILARYYDQYIDFHLPLIRKGYAERCQAMIKSIKDYMPENGKYAVPTGGFFVWYQTPDRFFDSLQFVEKAIENGVVYVPGNAFYPQNGFNITTDSDLIPCEKPTNTMRLCYSLLSPKKITEGIKRLGDLLLNNQNNKKRGTSYLSNFPNQNYMPV